MCRDLRPDTRQIALGLLIGLRGGNPARQQLRLALEFAVLEILQRPQIIQRGDRFLVVETGEQIARLTVLPSHLQRSTMRPRTRGLERDQVSGSTAPVA